MEPTSSGRPRRRRRRRNNVQAFREGGTDVAVGTVASARSFQALRCLTEASAIYTLIRQRRPTPSCRGLSPYCGENSEPGRYVTESLTTNPRVRERTGPKGDIPPFSPMWSLTTPWEKLVKIGAKVVSHGRYVTFQLAEVAVSRDQFRKILSLIDDLRPRPPARC